MVIDGIDVVGDVPMREAAEYVKRAPKGTIALTIEPDGEWVNLYYHIAPAPFERIARITGYLTQTVDRWNDAKQAELRDRVKHSVTCEVAETSNTTCA